MEDIRCTNCGVTREQWVHWLAPVPWRSPPADQMQIVGWSGNTPLYEFLPGSIPCCKEPYPLGRTEVPEEELMYRSLPRGEDR